MRTSKKCPIRPFGQRSISSTFLFRASDRSGEIGKSEGSKALSQKSSRVSLSDFLNNKLHRCSVLPSLPAKVLPFSSPVSSEDSSKNAPHNLVGGGLEPKFSIDSALDLFKSVERVKNDSDEIPSGNGACVIDDKKLRQAGKRKTLFEDQEDKLFAQKRLVVLGENLKPIQRRRVAGKEPQPQYNHYENGGGWWDDNREGVDSEEIGCNEAWEGLNCTTLGGIEWH